MNLLPHSPHGCGRRQMCSRRLDSDGKRDRQSEQRRGEEEEEEEEEGEGEEEEEGEGELFLCLFFDVAELKGTKFACADWVLLAAPEFRTVN